jgi:DNA-binding NtrC family response regulator
MAADTIALVGISSSLEQAFARGAERAGMRAVAHARDVGSLAEERRLALVVVELGGSETRALLEVRALAKLAGDAPIVVLARNLGAQLGAHLIRLGVVDVIDLPASNDDIVAEALPARRSENDASGGGSLLGAAPAIVELRRRIEQIARAAVSVLIVGESGSGKEVVARRIHELSARKGRPFVHVECGALSRELAEVELFGCERGAVPGVREARRGFVELAGHGTLLLDEVGELGLREQAKLLRLLQSRECQRVGGVTALEAEARVIATTSQDLTSLIRRGTFRRDLYFRLSLFEIAIPPLRERRDDIPALVRAALEQLSSQMGLAAPRATAAFYERLSAHDWPGNMRELRSVLERLLVERPATVLEAEDLDGLLERSPTPGAGAANLADLRVLRAEDHAEAQRIAQVLFESGGNVSRATRRLGIPRTTLRRRIEEFGLEHLIPKD